MDLIKINKNYLNGEYRDNAEKTIVINPATDVVIGEIAKVTAEQVNMSIQAAKLAVQNVKQLSIEARKKLLALWAQKIRDNRNQIAEIITNEQGKILKESQAEIDYALGYIDYYTNFSLKDLEYSLESNNIFSNREVKYEPIGVVAAITPWNFPIAMYVRKFVAAFLAGCAMIVKPAQFTPMSAFYTMNLWLECNPPQDSMQMINGEATMISDILANSADVRKISFTGSTAVGMMIARSSAKTLKRLSLELGGNAPLIIFEDADLELACEMIIQGKFRNNGQSCIAINRVLVSKQIKNQLIEKLLPKILALKIGDGLNPENHLGPLIHREAVSRIQDMVEEAVREGAEIMCGGVREEPHTAFYKPTLINNCHANMAIFKQEIFGPVITLTEFNSEEEALLIANSTEYGLAAYLCGKNLERNQYFAENLDFGMIGSNDTRISDAAIPFGGIKFSGYGREGGKEGLLEYLQTKYVGIK